MKTYRIKYPNGQHGDVIYTNPHVAWAVASKQGAEVVQIGNTTTVDEQKRLFRMEQAQGRGKDAVDVATTTARRAR